jgi:hypothetical protein
VRAPGTGGLDRGPRKLPVAAACSSRRHRLRRHANSATAASPARRPAATARGTRRRGCRPACAGRRRGAGGTLSMNSLASSTLTGWLVPLTLPSVTLTKGAIYNLLFWVLGPQASIYDRLGIVPQRTGNAAPLAAPRNAYRAGGGRWLELSGTTQSIAVRVMRIVARPDLIDEPWFVDHAGRLEHADELDESIQAWINGHTTEEVLAAFEESDRSHLLDRGVRGGPPLPRARDRDQRSASTAWPTADAGTQDSSPSRPARGRRSCRADRRTHRSGPGRITRISSTSRRSTATLSASLRSSSTFARVR